jgi:hypothetical protein
MDRTLEFKNFEHVNDLISADLYVDDKFIVRLSDNVPHIMHLANSGITLYDYFRASVIDYLKLKNIHFQGKDIYSSIVKNVH